MAEKKNKIRLPRLPQRSFFYILICSSGILFLLLLGIIPNQKEIASLDKEINSISVRAADEKILMTLFKGLLKKGSHIADITKLPFPKEKGLGKSKVATISSNFQKIAHSSNLDLIKCSLDLGELDSLSGRLKVNLSLEGELHDFRKFMIGLGELPFVDHLEQIKITAGYKAKIYNIKIWLVVEASR